MQLVKPVNRAVPLYTTLYDKFRGVDMRADPEKIDNTRSPYAPNLTVGSGGFPEKRLGYRDLTSVEAPINGLYYVNIDNAEFYIIHGGTKLYRWNGTKQGVPSVIKQGVNNARSVGFVMSGKFWILTGNDYLVYDGVAVKAVIDIAHIPVTLAGSKPDGQMAFPNKPQVFPKIQRAPNMLNPKRINSFLGDGTSKIYQLDAVEIDNTSIIVKVDGVQKKMGSDYVVNYIAGIVTFTTAPPIPIKNGIACDNDNVEVQFAKTVSANAEKIKKCSICTLYGVGSNDRAFLSGNPDFPATDWHSELYDPSYIPDLSESLIGSDSNAIMGYCKIGEYLAVIKEDNAQDSTVFLRSAKYEKGNSELPEAVFPLKQGITGEGAISKKAIGKLSDEPLFLSRNGIYAITSNMVTAERTVQNRSWFVDPMLIKEPYLETAICTEWNGQFIVCVNSHCYILDGKQAKSHVSQAKGDHVYECYHWNNIPAVCFLEHNGDLYFGTNSGTICRFNNDILLMNKYSDNGVAIKCSWQTKADYDGDFTRYKTMPKRGCALMLKPYTRSSCTITIRTDNDFEKFIRTQFNDIFSFNDFDFERVSFNTNDGPQVIPFNKKVKKYITAQIIVSNDVLNEGFGILGIIKRYTKGNYVRK